MSELGAPKNAFIAVTSEDGQLNESDNFHKQRRFVSHTLKQMSDECLVLAAKDGDADAFVELRERHSSKILSTAYRITRNWKMRRMLSKIPFLTFYPSQ
jgi:hypothetical protein